MAERVGRDFEHILDGLWARKALEASPRGSLRVFLAGAYVGAALAGRKVDMGNVLSQFLPFVRESGCSDVAILRGLMQEGLLSGNPIGVEACILAGYESCKDCGSAPYAYSADGGDVSTPSGGAGNSVTFPYGENDYRDEEDVY